MPSARTPAYLPWEIWWSVTATLVAPHDRVSNDEFPKDRLSVHEIAHMRRANPVQK
ncbi:hypothetical protein C7S17_0238 [Burkholderia thailandensis]|nr:hypothetical protein [Burkholderia thailandensis]